MGKYPPYFRKAARQLTKIYKIQLQYHKLKARQRKKEYYIELSENQSEPKQNIPACMACYLKHL